MTTDVQELRKELDALRKAIAEGTAIKTVTRVQVDTTYLCPNDPNRKKVLDADGFVLPEDAPTHLGGYITDIKFTGEKKRTFMPDGKSYQFEIQHKSALWTCSTCGAEIKLDPYPV